MDELHKLPIGELFAMSESMGLRLNPEKTRHHVVFEICKTHILQGDTVLVDGVLDLSNEGSGQIRFARYSFRPGPQDPYLPVGASRRMRLKSGHRVMARLRAPQQRERLLIVEEILTIEGAPASEWSEPTDFEKLTASFPDTRIPLETANFPSVSARLVDLIAPLGRGQRGLLVAPPRAGKTILMKELAKAILTNCPEMVVMLLLVDERPEEVTELRRMLEGAEVYASTFDEPPSRHIHLSELVSERSKRLVEIGRHVVIFIDSITRLSRGYNNGQSGKGRMMSGGVDSKALIKPKRFFGSARNTIEGGSLTILATALVETNSRMDDLIFEEYKGTGNMEIKLDRYLSERRVFPAVDLPQSGTRKDELLYHPREYEKISVLRRQLAALPPVEATEVLVHAIKSTNSNAELLLGGLSRSNRS
jgi:transcription termination factor Rho